MQLKSITLIFVCAMATGLMASPLAEADSGERTELYREKGSYGGSLIYYGPASGTKTRRLEAAKVKLEERLFGFGSDPKTCPDTAEPSCSTSNTARNDICDKLVTELFANSNIKVGKSPRQICFFAPDACCVSWGSEVPNLTKGDLAGHAMKILNTCTSNGISGKMPNVRVAGTCTEFCLSNRGTHC